MTGDELAAISVGRKKILEHTKEKIQNAIPDGRTINMMFVGPRGVGKSHTVLRLAHELERGGNVTLARLSEDEYSVSSLEGFLARVLDVLGERPGGDGVVERARKVFLEYRRRGRPVVIAAENMQMLFPQMEDDLPKLRSIILEDQSFFMICTALYVFGQVASLSAPFYNFFEIVKLRGLNAGEIGELIERRLGCVNDRDPAAGTPADALNLPGLRILTGGNPRLIHALCDIMIQNDSADNLEKNTMAMLDQLTPFYQARMEVMPPERRRVFDALALSSGPSTPTELASVLATKNTIVTAQLSRLRHEGVVDRIKLRQKKETRYQISDRLYRIWREFRTREGPARVRSFVEFLGLWYSGDKLVDEYYRAANAFESAFPISTPRARSELRSICSVLEAMLDVHGLWGDTSVHGLWGDTMQKFIDVRDYDGARDEIKRLRDVVRSDPDEFVSMCKNLVIDGAELRLLSSRMRAERIAEITDGMNRVYSEAGKYDGRSSQEKTNACMAITGVVKCATSLGNLDLAEKLNNAALALDENSVSYIVNQVMIMWARKDYDGALGVIESVLHKYNNPYLVALRAYTYTLMQNKDLAMQDAQSLLQKNACVGFALPVYAAFSTPQDLLETLKKKLVVIEDTSLQMRDLASSLVLSMIILRLLYYSPSTSDTGDMLECIRILEPHITAKTVKYCIPYLVDAGHDIGALERVLGVMFEAIPKDQMGMLVVLKRSVEYILTSNPDVLEGLHPEQRDLSFDIIAKLSPSTAIPQEILDST